MNEIVEGLYNKIANKANEMIPVKWSKILLNAEIQPGVITSYYVFYPENENRLVEFGDMSDIYGIQRNSLLADYFELNDLINELNNETVNENGDRWSIMTFMLNKDGNFSIDYSYENLEDTDVLTRRKILKEKYLK